MNVCDLNIHSRTIFSLCEGGAMVCTVQYARKPKITFPLNIQPPFSILPLLSYDVCTKDIMAAAGISVIGLPCIID